MPEANEKILALRKLTHASSAAANAMRVLQEAALEAEENEVLFEAESLEKKFCQMFRKYDQLSTDERRRN